MINKILPIAMSLMLVGCHAIQSYPVPIKHYFSIDKIQARVESTTPVGEACSPEFFFDNKTGAIVGAATGAAVAAAMGGTTLVITASSFYAGAIGADVEKTSRVSEPEMACLPSGYEMRVSYYHPSTKELISHYVVIDRKVQHPTIEIPMSWVPET